MGRLLLIVALPTPWLAVSCGGSSETSKPGGDAGSPTGEGGEGNASTGGTKATGGKGTGGSKATGGTKATGSAGEGGTLVAGGGEPSASGGEGGVPAVDLCIGVKCAYGQECVDGACESACATGKIMCSDSCIDPKIDNLFCGAVKTCDKGAGPNPQTPPLGEGGAGGAGGAPSDVAAPNANAGERCAVGYSCLAGKCTFNGLKPGSDVVFKRDGFSVQCKEWTNNVCTKPWIQVPLNAVKTVPNCAEPIDTTTLRPVWFGGNDGEEEARTFCWIATGNSNVRSHNTNGASSMECGWMYGMYEPQTLDCQDYRRYALVDSPGDIPDITWSFDILTGGGCRFGTYSEFECYWE